MSIRVELSNDTANVFIEIDLYLPGVKLLQAELEKLLANDQLKKVYIDFSHVTHIVSSALSQLIVFYRKTSERGCEIVLCNIKEDVKELFLAVQMDKIFKID